MRDWRQINWSKIQMNKWKGNQRRGNLSKFTCWLDSWYQPVTFLVAKNLNCLLSLVLSVMHGHWTARSLVTNSYLCITLEKFWRRNKITPKYDFLMSLTRARERARATFDFSGDQMWPNPLLLTRNIQQKLAIKSKRNRNFWEILNIIVDPGDYFALRWRE